MKLALIQLNIAWEDKKANFAAAEALIKKASEAHCDIAVLPEMFTTGCSMNVSLTAEEEGGQTDAFLSKMAKKYAIYMIAGFALRAEDKAKARNTAAVYDRDGNLAARFTKLHPFSLTHEDTYYAAGSDIVTFAVENMPASIFICYDLRFPEVFRKIARQVQAIFVIANWPASRKLHWETLLRARAIENQCFVIGVNRTGTDGNGLYHCGASHVFDPFGTDLCCGKEDEELLICEFDPEETERIRSKFPFLKDMRHCT